MKGIKMDNLTKLRYWTFKILPLVYDDSLSYYEVLAKVTAKVNELVDSNNTMPQAITDEISKQLDESYAININNKINSAVNTVTENANNQIDKLANEVYAKLITAIATDEGTNTFTKDAKSGGELIFLNNTLYKVTAVMPAGTNYIVGTNIVPINISKELKTIKETYISSNNEHWNERSANNYDTDVYLYWKDILYITTKDIKVNDILYDNGNNQNLKQVTLASEISKHKAQIDVNNKNIETLQSEQTNQKNRIDNIVAQSGNDNTEIVDARIWSNELGNKTSTNLGEAIRGQIDAVSKMTFQADYFRIQGSVDSVVNDSNNNRGIIKITTSKYSIYLGFANVNNKAYYFSPVNAEVGTQYTYTITQDEFLIADTSIGANNIKIVKLNELKPSYIILASYGARQLYGKLIEEYSKNIGTTENPSLGTKKYSTIGESIYDQINSVAYLTFQADYFRIQGSVDSVVNDSNNNRGIIKITTSKYSIYLGFANVNNKAYYFSPVNAEVGTQYTYTITQDEFLIADTSIGANNIKIVKLNELKPSYIILASYGARQLYGKLIEEYNKNIKPAIKDSLNNNVVSICRIADGQKEPLQSKAGFTAAANAGYKILLADLRWTSDHIGVMLHDDYPNQNYKNVYSDSGELITSTTPYSDMTYEQIMKFDYGVYKGEIYKGTRVLTLDDFISLCKLLNVKPFIEMKVEPNDDEYDSLFSTIAKYGMTSNTIYSPFSINRIKNLYNKNNNALINMDGILTSTDLTEALSFIRSNNPKIFAISNFTKNRNIFTNDAIKNLGLYNINILFQAITSVQNAENYYKNNTDNINICKYVVTQNGTIIQNIISK